MRTGCCRVRVWVILLLCSTTAAVVTGADDLYYCLEDYKPIGTVLRTVPVNATAAGSSTVNSTSGQVARQCAAACDAAQECSGFRAVGPEVALGGASCHLLANSTAALPAALALEPNNPWPHVAANLSSLDNIPLRSISWMCWRRLADWDAFGQATHNLIMSGNVNGAAADDHQDFCAFGVDVAGHNLRQDVVNITAPAQCDALCRNNNTDCTFWIFVASTPEQAQLQPARNCFSKTYAFRGENGWTGKPKSDIWIADSQVTCFSKLQDWRHLGLVLSPSIKSIQSAGNFFTVYPERVTWAEAAATCRQLPGGKLAVVDSPNLLRVVSSQLLETLPFQTGIRSAWVGVTGNNTRYDPAAANASDPTAAGSVSTAKTQNPRLQQDSPPETTLAWVNGSQVASGLLRRPDTLEKIWTGHDVVTSQVWVPASDKGVCGRVLVQLPPTESPVDPSALNAAVLPGIWYFDCNKPASFICQSTAAPTEPMNSREVIPSRAAAIEGENSSSGSSAGAQQAAWKTALAVILPVLAVALLGYQLLHLYSRKMARLPDLIRQQRKRALGQPRTGRMSLVMTDIQGFTHLMQGDADQTTQALLLHNNVIKHAVYDNVGWVVEQEGDSFSVVFHEPEDAVAFSLQVQQALLQQSWPAGVRYDDEWEGAASLLDCRTASQKESQAANTDAHAAAAAIAAAADANRSHHSERGLSLWHEDDTAAAEGGGSQSSRRSLASFGAHLLGCEHTSRGGRSRSFTAAGTGRVLPTHQRSRSIDGNDVQDTAPQRIDSTTSGASSGSASLAVQRGAALGLMNQSMSSAGGGGSGGGQTLAAMNADNPRQLSAISADSRSPWFWERAATPSTIAPAASFASTATAAGGFAGAGGSSRRSVLSPRPRNMWLFQQLLSPRPDQQQKLFRGLRVRMGVVTGEVDRGQELKSSDLYRQAQDVSGAAHGGQVLMDEASFLAVKEALWRLGAVGPNGLDYDALNASKSAGHGGRSGGRGDGSCWDESCLPGCVPGSGLSLRRDVSSISGGSQSIAGSSQLAIALDMGCYEMLTPSDPAYPGSNTASNSSSSNRKVTACVQLWTADLGDKLVQQYQQYMQQQLSRQGSLQQSEEGFDNSFDEEAPYIVHKPQRSMQQQQQQKQQGGQQHAALGLRQASVGARSASKSHRAGLSGPYADWKQQQQQHPGFVGRSKSVTLGSIPHSWQHVTSSLFGVGHLPPILPGGANNPGSTADGPLDGALAHRRSLVGYCSISAVLRRNIRLYQVVPPALAGRAALFGHQLDLPHNWRVLDQPYFAAPGLSSSSWAAAAAEATAAAVAGAEQLRQRVPGRSSSCELYRMQPPPLRVESAPDVQAALRAAGAAATAGAVSPATGVGGVGDRVGHEAATAVAVGPDSALSEAALQQQDQQQLGGHTPFLTAAQHRLSSSETQSAHSSAAGADPIAIAAAAATAGAAAAAAAAYTESSSHQQTELFDPAASQLSSSPHGAVRQGSASVQAVQAGRLQHSSTSSHRAAPNSLPQGLMHYMPSSSLSTSPSPSPAAAAGAMPPGVGGGHSRAQSVLVLRAASLQLNVGPSGLLLGPGPDRRGGGGPGSRNKLSGSHPTRALFPPVTILFAAVEGSGELLRYPVLARSVHVMLHHLMLQLLRAFPGSYLVRAQQGDLRYMLAFTSTPAAVAWGLTLQEAALYLPYPQEVLGLGSFGVQLDQGGRLVFRGPRFKMGLSEGGPKVIMPDHMGRADYHGSFVNLAARYATVAAQGGQLVTDADTARQVLWHWRAHNNPGITNSSFVSVSSRSTSNAQLQGSTRAQPPPPPQPTAGAVTGAADDSAAVAQLEAAAAAGAGGVVPGSSTAADSHVLLIQPPESAAVAASVAATGAAATADVVVECSWLGSYLFKGNPSPVSMVCFCPSVLSGRQYATQAVTSSKGVRVLQRVGLMDHAIVRLPAAVEGFGPWEEAATGGSNAA